ncbi:Enhancer of filamentation 1 [Bagarius yarrelli]|uniref:Enhancer of filamentation 1 n=1 Tax=Bagarius yarrelli TaxID=175774 RepID=A0A556U680_BAGYA|nr:Enhancer of filamentation 1 [Bagarius yarrelli]
MAESVEEGYRLTEVTDQLNKADITLNPRSAHYLLQVSSDGKSLSQRPLNSPPPAPTNETYKLCICVSSTNLLNTRAYFELKVTQYVPWTLGLRTESFDADSHPDTDPDTGIWTIASEDGRIIINDGTPTSTRHATPARLGLYLDYARGQVSFYDAVAERHLYTYLTTFKEKLRFYAGVGVGMKETHVRVLTQILVAVMSLSTVLAKALYDNAAESPEELAFRKGDILMVLEQEQDGGPGWWLCSLHGRQGIAPANRLRLLQTAPDARRAPSVDQLNGHRMEDGDGVYLSPPSLAEGVYQSPGGTSGPGSRPRSHSSSGARPRPDWADIGVEGRPRSPSLRGRTGEVGLVYQTPGTVAPQYRSQGASESVYLSPSAVPRALAESGGEAAYLSPRDSSITGNSDTCYLVPRTTVAAVSGEDFYQTPVSTAPVPVLQDRVASQGKAGQEPPGMYQTPSTPGTAITRTPQAERKLSAGSVVSSATSGQILNTPPTSRSSATCAVTRGKTPQATVKGSPLLMRTGKSGLPGSPNFGRKPPPPAPPVRSVTRKDLPQGQAPSLATKPTMQAVPPTETTNEEKQRQMLKDGDKKKDIQVVKKECVASDDRKHDDQVYDTPPRNRWQQPVPTVSLEESESIYNTPRAVPLHTEQGLEIYDVPTHALNQPPDPQQQTYNVPASLLLNEDIDEDLYSVPSLPGLPLDSGEISGSIGEERRSAELYSIPSPGKAELVSEDVSEADGGIYDMPALTMDIPACRLSASSTGSGDIQWKNSLSALVQSALNSASIVTVPSRDLAASLAEILSVWKAGHSGEVPASLQQTWSRLSELLPALSVCGLSPPGDSLLAMVCRALEDSATILQSQTRPRLPSQESLSRRPLPALPVAEVKPMAGGMGSRKGSWIQERPLPPPPVPAFPLPPAPASFTLAGQMGEDEQGNEYAGIGLTPAPPSYPAGDSVGYVKLQLSPSPPLPVSLSLEDSELLSFYSSQSLSHLSCLADAIDSLFSSVQGNQPPRVFVSRGKSLIVTAHKLVFIGDTLARLLSSTDLRAKVTTSSGRLCQALKSVVVATKDAAQNYPSVQATQEMVDRVAELSQHAAGFSGLLQRLAEIS